VANNGDCSTPVHGSLVLRTIDPYQESRQRGYSRFICKPYRPPPAVERAAPGSLARAISTAWRQYGRHAGSFVYFIRCEAFVKIGTGQNINARMREFAVGNPFPLSVLGCMPGDGTFENALHRICADYRHRGEWFHHHGELASAIHDFAKPEREWPSKRERLAAIKSGADTAQALRLIRRMK
jgi:hypothetical protein